MLLRKWFSLSESLWSKISIDFNNLGKFFSKCFLICLYLACCSSSTVPSQVARGTGGDHSYDVFAATTLFWGWEMTLISIWLFWGVLCQQIIKSSFSLLWLETGHVGAGEAIVIGPHFQSESTFSYWYKKTWLNNWRILCYSFLNISS